MTERKNKTRDMKIDQGKDTRMIFMINSKSN